MIPCTNRLTRKLEGQVQPTFYRQCLPIAAGRSKVGLGSQWSLGARCTVSSHYSYDSRTTSQRLHYERSQTISLSRCTVTVHSLYSLSTVGQLAFLIAQKRCNLLRSVFWCDRKTAIERDHAAIASDQTKFRVAEGRSKVTVRCDWGIMESYVTRATLKLLWSKFTNPNLTTNPILNRQLWI